MNSDYKNLIFTKHALDRLKNRTITQDYIYQTVNFPEKKHPAGKNNSLKFIKHINNRQVQVVASYLKDENKWLVISVWVRGEEDKLPLMWQLLILPFKLILWIIKKLLKFIFTKKS